MTTLTPGTLLDCTFPPALGDDAALRGQRPGIVIGQDDHLGLLVWPVTTQNGPHSRRSPYIDERGVYGRVRVDCPRWVGPESIRRERGAELSATTTRRLLELSRDRLVGIGQRDLYRAAKRQLAY